MFFDRSDQSQLFFVSLILQIINRRNQRFKLLQYFIIHSLLKSDSQLSSDFFMVNLEKLFQINKKINQIKKNLQLREEKAQEWTASYEKILQKTFSATTPYFNSHNTMKCEFQRPSKQDSNELTNSSIEKKKSLKRRVRESRQKINRFHNELKQLQQLIELRTKFHVKKQPKLERVGHKQELSNYEKLNTQLKLNKPFNNPMILSGVMSNSLFKNSIRNLKDRANPFLGLKIQKMIELYQEAKQPGKQNFTNSTLGMGLQFTPYFHVKKDYKREQILLNKNFGQNHSIPSLKSQKGTIDSHFSQEKNRKKKSENLTKALETKIKEKNQIYCTYFDQNKKDFKQVKIQTKSNIFEKRMKHLLKQTINFSNCQGKYVQMLKKTKDQEKKLYLKNLKNSVGKVRANHTYKRVFELK